MNKRKRHALYQEGFLCLFDTQGEMFFRAKTYIAYAGYALGTVHRGLCDEQARVLNPEGIDPCDDALPWSPAWMDAAFLHEENGDMDAFCFIGHFEIYHEHKNKLRYSFGRVYMDGPIGITPVHATDAEGWECQYFDANLFGTINMDKLRVVID